MKVRIAVMLGLALVGCTAPDEAAVVFPSEVATSVDTPGPTGEQRAASILSAWDQQRAAAYARGDVRRLRSLYVAGSRAGSADVRMLRAYVERGLVVRGMRIQVLSLEVLRSSSSLLRVRVTDRLVGAVAHGPTASVSLPRDTPTTRVLTLRLVTGRWLVDSVV